MRFLKGAAAWGGLEEGRYVVKMKVQCASQLETLDFGDKR